MATWWVTVRSDPGIQALTSEPLSRIRDATDEDDEVTARPDGGATVRLQVEAIDATAAELIGGRRWRRVFEQAGVRPGTVQGITVVAAPGSRARS